METFRNKLKKRIVFGSVYCCLIPLLAIVLHFCVGETLSSGFTLGFATGIAAVALFLYIAETDERNQYIQSRCAVSGILIIQAAVALATLVSSYFNRTVFFTLLASTYCIALIVGGCKLYYHKKLS